MTPFSRLRRIGAPIASAVATAALLTGALWVQHSREAWPLAPRDPALAAIKAPSAVATTRSASTPDRVPVDVTASTLQELDIRLEVVRRESLTQSVRAVATVVPDESRISHVHTRVAGWVERLDVSTTGEMVQAGQPLFAIIEANRWWVDANFKETDLARIKPGQKATIRLDMYPGTTLDGVVESISAGSGATFSVLPPENATGNWVKVTQRFPVRIKITSSPAPDKPLRMGASATVTIDTTEGQR